MRKDKRRAIAHERRKWMIHFHTPNGKPDKLRRPGRKWEPEAYAGPEKMTYCGGHGVDLFASNKQSRKSRANEGSKESIEQRINEVSLQTYLQQVQEYETLLNPLFKIMASSMGGAPGCPHPSEAGWGPIGNRLPEALEDIGAIPREWKEQRSEFERNELRKQRELKRMQKILEDEEFLREQERKLLLQDTDGLSAYNDFFDHDGEKEGEQDGQGKKEDHKQHQKQEQPRMKIRGSTIAVSSSSKGLGAKTLVAPSILQGEENEKKKIRGVTEEERQRIERRKQRHRKRHVGAAVIPWNLLDELDGEKRKFESEKSYLEFYHKF